MKRLLIRLAINTVALYSAVALRSDASTIQQSENWLSFVWLALIFGIINAFLKPVISLLSCPLIILTLGLGTLLINTLLFFLAGLIGQQVGVGFTVEGALPAFLGALIVSVVSFLLSMFFKSELKRK